MKNVAALGLALAMAAPAAEAPAMGRSGSRPATRGPGQPPEILPNENLVVDGIPKLPAVLAEKAGRYTESRSASAAASSSSSTDSTWRRATPLSSPTAGGRRTASACGRTPETGSRTARRGGTARTGTSGS